ncbi:hypothetical protein [Lamprobacter modestohalophilus]|nr:hypothetical protein [Lamprobacter modestohalophilus]
MWRLLSAAPAFEEPMMRFKFQWRKFLFGTIVVMGFEQNSIAAEAELGAQVLRVLVEADDTNGGCMALLSVNPANLLPTCGDGWVTFSCSGQYTDNIRAYRMLDQAQLALATNRTVMVSYTDDMRHGGYCFARRIDVLQ